MERKTVRFQKSGEKWTSGGKQMDATSVQSLIDKLRDLSAIKFVDSGIHHAGDRTHGNLGRRQACRERCRSQRTAISYFAKRENEPAIYELDRKSRRGNPARRRRCERASAAAEKMRALHTDLYQLTMAAGYFESGKARRDGGVRVVRPAACPRIATYLIAAGLQQAVEYLLNLRFDDRADRLSANAAAVPARFRQNSGIIYDVPLHRRSVRNAGRHAFLRRASR